MKGDSFVFHSPLALRFLDEELYDTQTEELCDIR